MGKYKITQHQTSVDIDLSKLSKEQIIIRAKEIEKTGEKKRCNTCMKEKLLSLFRLRTSLRGVKCIYYTPKCKDCNARVRGTKEIGKLLHAKTLFDKGFRRCVTCKDTKPLTEYYTNKSVSTGYSNECKPCHSVTSLRGYHNRKNK